MSKKQSRATKQANAERAAERAAASRREQERKDRRRRSVVVGAAVLAVVAVVLVVATVVRSAWDDPGGGPGQVAGAPRGVVDEYAVPLGSADAKVTVDVYEDFLCPFCAEFERATGSMLERYVGSGEVQVRYHPIAFLDGASEGTDYSTRAMNAVGVVLDERGRQAAIELHDLLFAKQPAEGTPGLSDEQLVTLAVRAGADRTAVESPIMDRRFEQWVASATEAAREKGVMSTPTVLVDGEELEDPGVKSLRAAIDTARAD